MNLEGRIQRLRRAVIPPCPDELAWLAKLAERFGVDVSPHAPQVFAEVSERCYGDLDYTGIGERPLFPCRPPRSTSRRHHRLRRETARGAASASSPIDRSSRARPSNASPSSSSSDPLQRSSSLPQTPRSSTPRPGWTVNVRSNGTSVELRARVNKNLVEGVARIAVEHAEGLGTHVEVGAREPDLGKLLAGSSGAARSAGPEGTVLVIRPRRAPCRERRQAAPEAGSAGREAAPARGAHERALVDRPDQGRRDRQPAPRACSRT